MIYSVRIDGVVVYDEDEGRALTGVQLEDALNEAGSLSFTMYPGHDYYDKPKVLTSDVEVYENDELIWFGRIIKIEKGLYNEKKIECEGALGYFNDSIQRPAEYGEKDDALFSVIDFFSILIENHNEQVPANRRFEVGDVTIDEKFVYRKLNYENTLSCLTTMCANAEGGYFVTRKKNGKNYIDWVKNIDNTNNQPAQYALNITDLNQILDGRDFKTAVIPIGEDENGNTLTIVDVNYGEDFIRSDAADEYGLIYEVVEFSGITKAIDLLEAGEKWLKEKQFDNLSIEVDVVDLANLDTDEGYRPFRIGQKVHCSSSPNLIDTYYPIVKMGIDLSSGSKRIVLSKIKKRTLTEIYKDDSSSGGGVASSANSSSGGSSGGGGSVGATVYNGKLTIKRNGIIIDTFTANQKGNTTVDIEVPGNETSDINFNELFA